MTKIKYKDYVGLVKFDGKAGVLRGHVVNLRDTITFQGKTVDEFRQAFRDSVNEYLEFCAHLGRSPEKPNPSVLVTRVSPETLRNLTLVAADRGLSVPSLVKNVLGEIARNKARNVIGEASDLAAPTKNIVKPRPKKEKTKAKATPPETTSANPPAKSRKG